MIEDPDHQCRAFFQRQQDFFGQSVHGTGHASDTLTRSAADLKALVDVWGPIGDGLRVMQEVKRQFDPTATLNPGRGPGGL